MVSAVVTLWAAWMEIEMQRGLWRRLKVKAGVLGAGALLFQFGDLGCTSFFTNAGLSSMNFCFLLNCNDGALGGLIDFCSPVNFTSFVGGAQANENDFLADCP